VNLSPHELRLRADEAKEHYARCDLCAHDCLVDRTRGPAGRCNEGDGLFLAGAGVHFGEEQVLIGDGGSARRGSGLLLVGGCNLACRYCETFDFSLERRGLVATSEDELAGLLLDFQKQGAANVNFVTPTHVLPALLGGLARAAVHGFALPIVWNCGGYESLEALRLLEGVVDIYLPDAKYGDDGAGLALSGCRDYVSALDESLREMHRQVGDLQVEGGLATTGVLVRHLVLPDDAAAPARLMPLLADISPALWLNVMSQYRPVHEARLLPVLSRAVQPVEVQAAVTLARAAGLRNLLVDGRPPQPAIAHPLRGATVGG
jgi:putative pyruvate formate lyase activating enzyme